jgi:hypothetical protein
MRVTRLVMAGLMVSAMVAGAALAQEGFPLKGSWLGDWGPNKPRAIKSSSSWTGTANHQRHDQSGTENILSRCDAPTPPPPRLPEAWRWWCRWWRNGAGAAVDVDMARRLLPQRVPQHQQRPRQLLLFLRLPRTGSSFEGTPDKSEPPSTMWSMKIQNGPGKSSRKEPGRRAQPERLQNRPAVGL